MCPPLTCFWAFMFLLLIIICLGEPKGQVRISQPLVSRGSFLYHLLFLPYISSLDCFVFFHSFSFFVICLWHNPDYAISFILLFESYRNWSYTEIDKSKLSYMQLQQSLIVFLFSIFGIIHTVHDNELHKRRSYFIISFTNA